MLATWMSLPSIRFWLARSIQTASPLVAPIEVAADDVVLRAVQDPDAAGVRDERVRRGGSLPSTPDMKPGDGLARRRAFGSSGAVGLAEAHAGFLVQLRRDALDDVPLGARCSA